MMVESQNSGQSGESGMDVMRYVRLVLERRRLFCIIAVAVMLLAIVASYAMPKKYTAKSLVFIEQNVVSDLVKGIAITPSMDMRIKAIRVTMLSRSMLQRVIKELDLDVTLNNSAEWDAMVKKIEKKLSVRLDEKRGVFTIAITDRDPVLARDIVNTMTRLYIEDNTSEKRKESYEATRFLAEQIETFKKRIQEIEQKIDDFKRESGFLLATDESSIRRDIDRVQDELEEVRIRINELNSARQLLIGDTPSNRLLEQQQQALASLKASYTDEHPKVLRLKSAIASTQQRLDENLRAERQQVYRSGEYRGIKVQLTSLEAMQKNYEEEIAEKRSMLQQIPTLRTQLAELERQRHNEVLIYEKLVSRYGQSEVSKEMELQDKSVSFRVLDPAIVPAIHTSPNRPLIIAGGIFGGFVIAFGIIVLMDLLNPAIRTVDELKRLGINVFAVVPKMTTEENRRKQRNMDLRLLFFTGSAFAVAIFFLVIEVLRIPLVDNALALLKRHMGV
ncbi:XrtA system polysaccharide chain length determinant [Salidesulfovibrio brasiliensis]|uniref:XrtA system polysaccharide chain length determinant n=1 Tax=Salidesulfovibrio brasiliensis TaxID=221711 RepID=UPI000B1808D3|nr:XrtA system polysaccharide chain length determinant [Salidesulfovibrio brasiliensis]